MPTREEKIAFIQSQLASRAQQAPQSEQAPMSREDKIAFIQQKLAEQQPKEEASAIGSGVRKFLQGASGGLSDEAAGIVESAGRVVGLNGLGGPIKNISKNPDGATLDLDKLKQAYELGRNHEREALAKDSKDNPKISTVAELGGMLASPINKILPGASVPTQGAVVGGISGFGNSEADNVTDLLKDTGIGVGLGYGGGKISKLPASALGAGAGATAKYLTSDSQDTSGKLEDALMGGVEGYAATKALQKAGPAVGNKLKDLAETQAVKAAGAMLKDFRQLNGVKKVSELGRYLLDSGGVKAGDTVEDIANKMATATESAGSKLDDIYQRAGEKFKEALNKEGFDPVKDKQKILDAAKAELGEHANGKAALNKLSTYLDEVAERHGEGVLPPRVANDVKSAMDQQINYSRNPLAKDPASETAFGVGRKEVAKSIDNSMNYLGDDELSQELKAANKEYGNAKTSKNISQDRVSREQAKMMFGLTDHIVGAGLGAAEGAREGGSPGAVIGAAAGAVGSKMVRKYGSAIIAETADKISQSLLRNPQLKELSASNPTAFKTIVQDLTTHVLPERPPIQLPRAADKKDDTAQAPTKGPDKFVNDGIQKLKEHTADKLPDETLNDLKSDPKGRELLKQASLLKPGSKAMENLLSKIKNMKAGV